MLSTSIYWNIFTVGLCALQYVQGKENILFKVQLFKQKGHRRDEEARTKEQHSWKRKDEIMITQARAGHWHAYGSNYVNRNAPFLAAPASPQEHEQKMASQFSSAQPKRLLYEKRKKMCLILTYLLHSYEMLRQNLKKKWKIENYWLCFTSLNERPLLVAKVTISHKRKVDWNSLLGFVPSRSFFLCHVKFISYDVFKQCVCSLVSQFYVSIIYLLSILFVDVHTNFPFPAHHTL